MRCIEKGGNEERERVETIEWREIEKIESRGRSRERGGIDKIFTREVWAMERKGDGKERERDGRYEKHASCFQVSFSPSLCDFQQGFEVDLEHRDCSFQQGTVNPVVTKPC